MTSTVFPRWKFEPTVNLGHVLTIAALMAGGVSVYVGVFQTLTEIVVRVKTLEGALAGAEERRVQLAQNTVAIAELHTAIGDIRVSNAKIVDQLTGIRIDLGVIGRRGRSGGPD